MPISQKTSYCVTNAKSFYASYGRGDSGSELTISLDERDELCIELDFEDLKSLSTTILARIERIEGRLAEKFQEQLNTLNGEDN